MPFSSLFLFLTRMANYYLPRPQPLHPNVAFCAVTFLLWYLPDFMNDLFVSVVLLNYQPSLNFHWLFSPDLGNPILIKVLMIGFYDLYFIQQSMMWSKYNYQTAQGLINFCIKNSRVSFRFKCQSSQASINWASMISNFSLNRCGQLASFYVCNWWI